MSLDLFVYGTEPVSTDRMMSVIEEIGGLRLIGQIDSASISAVIERNLRGSFTSTASLDGPFDCEREDLPPAVLADAVGVQVMYQLVVEGSSQTSFRIVNRVARCLASACSGVVYDQQTDAVTWPRKSIRTFKPERQDLIDLVNYSWYFRRNEAASGLPNVLLRILKLFAPEALPRRFGGYEPFQFKYEMVGEAGLVEQWETETTGLFWSARKPFFGGSTHGLASEPSDTSMSHPIGDITISFDSRAFEDPRWRRDLEALFVSFAEKSGAFCAVARADKNIRSSGRGLTYGPEVEIAGGLTARGQWLGLPAEEPWLLWLGATYSDFLGGALDTSRMVWHQSRPRSDGGSSWYDRIPPEARMIHTDRGPGRSGERFRANDVPSGL